MNLRLRPHAASALWVLGALVTIASVAPSALASPYDAKSANALHDELERILTSAVKGNQVDYDAVAKQRTDLRSYLHRVGKADVSALGKDDKVAFYTNAYNALVLEAVLVHRRPESVLKVDGFFDKKEYTVAGESMTLNDLEKNHIRSSGDPRVHFIVNCASIDCPPLAPAAYRGATLDKMLDAQTRAYLTRRGEVVVDDKAKTIRVVQLFEWYRDDFGGDRGVRKLLAKYVPDHKTQVLDESYKLTYRPYDWALNAWVRPRPKPPASKR